MENLPYQGEGVNHSSTPQEITHKTEKAGKSPTRRAGKSPARQTKKSPRYYPSSCICLPLSGSALTSLLHSYEQHEWTSNVRVNGLAILLSWFVRQMKDCKAYTSKGVLISVDLSEQYVSEIKKPKNKQTITQPLALLVHIGVLEKTSDAIFCHIKTSATYRISPRYAGNIQEHRLQLSPLLQRKLLHAEPRREHRLNRKYPWRERLLADMPKIGIAQEARKLIAELTLKGEGGGGLKGIICAIDTGKHFAKISERGTITTSISSLPRTLKPFLTLNGEAAISCDISHAHHCFLPRLVKDRIDYKHREKPSGDLGHLETERLRFVERLSGPDYYRSWCNDQTDDKERKEKKDLINALLNMSNSRCTANPFYQWMRREFPHTFSIVESIKRDDNRNLSKQLQRYTSDAINGALQQIQQEGIAAIPQTDALLCQQQHSARVCQVIGERVFRESNGVRCKVNGVPFVHCPLPTKC